MFHDLTRRDFLKTTLVFSAMGMAPQFLTRTAEGATRAIRGFNDDRVLVVVQLGGGNDGLNTLVPYGDDAYYRLRPQLGLRPDKLVRVNDYLAFNDRLDDFMRLYEDGSLAVVQGVGYPNPDRSHFRSMEIWHTASDSDEFLGTGWIGRYFDHNCSGSARPQAGVAIGKERPQAFDGAEGFGVAFEDPRAFGWKAGEFGDTESRFTELNRATEGAESNLDFLRHVTSNAIMSSREVREAAERVHHTDRGGNRLARSLNMVASLIRGDLSTRIYFVSTGGFDTHANQAGLHDNLLGQVGQALAGFQERIRKDGTSNRVTTMVFSEFGRRVAENNSRGTDHGTAAPMFLMGDHVKPGLHGTTPNLTNLDDGDLRYTTDFRQVYATVLEDWFKADSAELLNGRFDSLGLLV